MWRTVVNNITDIIILSMSLRQLLFIFSQYSRIVFEHWRAASAGMIPKEDDDTMGDRCDTKKLYITGSGNASASDAEAGAGVAEDVVGAVF